nr:ComEC/Rec2 family competence protein [Mycobacterium sp. 1482292.6]
MVAALANLAVAGVIAPITVLGTAAAALCAIWPAAARLLIRFTGLELWWVDGVAHAAANMPGATVPVPEGMPGTLIVGGVTVLAVVLWRWRLFRVAAGVGALVGLAWALSGLG